MSGSRAWTAIAVCCAAWAALGGPVRAAEGPDSLAARLGDERCPVRDAALAALVELGEAAAPALERARGSADAEVRWRAEWALRMVHWGVNAELARSAGDAFADFEGKKWYERERAVSDLGPVGGKASIPALARVLTNEKSEPVRRAAAIGLLRMGPEGLAALDKAGGDLLGIPRDDPRLRIQIGNGFVEEGAYERAAAEYRKALKAAPKNATAWYNLGCALSRQKKVAEAVEALKSAVECGFDDVEWMKKDPDLDNLRETEEFKAFLKGVEKVEPPPQE